MKRAYSFSPHAVKYMYGEFEELCEHKQVYMYVGSVQFL